MKVSKTKRAFAFASVAALLAVAACGGEPAPAQTPASAPQASAPAAAAISGDVVTQGRLSGRSDHVTVGAVGIVRTDGGYELVLGDDFSLDGAPDPTLGFGIDGTFDPSSQFSALESISGGQRYKLPASFEPDVYNEFYVWCEQFSVPLGVASLPIPATPLVTGEFSGRSDHVTTGGVSVVESATGYQLVLADDFSLDGAPDPTLGFGKDGAFDEESQFSALNSISGGQVYDLPASFDPSAYNEVYVWCEQFSVPLGVAPLE